MRIQSIGLFMVVATSAVSISAQAQSLNIDYGFPETVPPQSYGAAAHQPGLWNNLLGADDPSGLKDIQGNSTAVQIVADLPFGLAYTDHPGTTGGDEALLDDYLDLHDTPSAFNIVGLIPGKYSVYTYAWAPDIDQFRTLVTVGHNTQSIGGVWNGTLEQGTTYAKHTITIANDQPLSIRTFGLGAGTLNGFQIVAKRQDLSITLARPLPAMVDPQVQAAVDVIIDEHQDHMVGQAKMYARIRGHRHFTQQHLVQVDGTLWRSLLPEASCGDVIEFYFEARGNQGGLQTLPYKPEQNLLSVNVCGVECIGICDVVDSASPQPHSNPDPTIPMSTSSIGPDASN